MPRGPRRSRARPAPGMRGPRTRTSPGRSGRSRPGQPAGPSIHAPTVARRFVWMAFQSTGSSPQGGRGRRRIDCRSIRSLALCPSTSSRAREAGRRRQAAHRVSTAAPAVSSAIIRSTLSMILLGRGMTPRRLNPTPNGLVSSSQSAAWVSHRGPPGQMSILRARKAEGRTNHATTSPTAIETARPRVRAPTEATTEIAAAASAVEASPAPESSTSRGSTPPRNTIKTTSGSVAAKPFAALSRPAAIVPTTISAPESSVVSSAYRLFRSRSEAIAGATCPTTSPIAMPACAKAVRPNATRANQAASRTEVLSQPHSSQTTTQPATPPATSNSATSRSRITLAHRTELTISRSRKGPGNITIPRKCVYDVANLLRH